MCLTLYGFCYLPQIQPLGKLASLGISSLLGVDYIEMYKNVAHLSSIFVHLNLGQYVSVIYYSLSNFF